MIRSKGFLFIIMAIILAGSSLFAQNNVQALPGENAILKSYRVILCLSRADFNLQQQAKAEKERLNSDVGYVSRLFRSGAMVFIRKQHIKGEERAKFSHILDLLHIMKTDMLQLDEAAFNKSYKDSCKALENLCTEYFVA
jgi:hypothetical protein